MILPEYRFPVLSLRYLCIFLTLIQTGVACTIPVFRFALDRWHPDPYRLSVRTKEVADPAVASFLRNLDASSGINLEVSRGNADHSSLHTPENDGSSTEIWKGALTKSELDRLLQSPARKQLVDQILAGSAAVWVLVDNGDPIEAERSAAIISKRLRYLEQVIRLPNIDPNDPSSRLGPGPPLKVAFSLLRIADPKAEEPLLNMLAAQTPELRDSKRPWVSVVFGRGRVLGSWPASSMEDAQIEELALFLSGACSCQVKRQNPGWDLLLSADWDTSLQAMGVPPTPTSGADEPASKSTNLAAETLRIEASRPDENPPRSRRVPVAWAALLVVLAWSLMRRKLPPS